MTLVSSDINTAKHHLENDELVAIPTETVYGMAGNGFDPKAIKSIFKVKNRPFYDPLILHTDSREKLSKWGFTIPDLLKPLAEAFWPGPLTLLLDKPQSVPDIISAGLPRVAVRIPKHDLTLRLLKSLDFPLAAPSANPFGYVSPTRPEHVLKHFEGKIPMILDGGPCGVGIESTIVGMEENEIVVYRLGGLSLERIEQRVGKVKVLSSSSRPSAPGMLIRHYAPGKKIKTVETQAEFDAEVNQHSACILFNLKLPALKASQIVVLSDSSNDNEAAQKFYDALQHWDSVENIEQILVERLPDFGLGRAINDRLQRAQSE